LIFQIPKVFAFVFLILRVLGEDFLLVHFVLKPLYALAYLYALYGLETSEPLMQITFTGSLE
jgi:hypothetical protein